METFKKVVSYYLMIALLITMMPSGRLYAADGAIVPRERAAGHTDGEALGPMAA